MYTTVLLYLCHGQRQWEREFGMETGLYSD